MRSVTWRSDSGATVVLSDVPPYIFRDLDDSLGATAETARAPRQDGTTTYNAALDPRTINVTGSIVAYGNKTLSAQKVLDRLRAEISAAFAPNRFGILTYQTEDGNRQIRCRPIAKPTLGGRINNTCTVDVEFVSDSPFWESSDVYTYIVGRLVRTWHFPMAFHPLIFGQYSPQAVIANPTAEIIYPTVEITSTAQQVTVANETSGKAISITRPIAENQKMVIRLEDASAEIWQRDAEGVYRLVEDVSHWLTLDSEPWGLIPGQNVVSITGGTSDDTPVTYIRYRVPYLGV